MKADATPFIGSRTDVLRALATATLLIGLAISGAQAETPEEGAKRILKAMSANVTGQKTISLKFDSDIEAITPQLEKIQFTNSGQLLLDRPDKLRASRTGGYADVELVFDGKTLSALGKNINAYAQIEAPGTIDELIERLRAEHGLALPAADLLLSQPYEELIADVLEAKHTGAASSRWNASTWHSATPKPIGSYGSRRETVLFRGNM